MNVDWQTLFYVVGTAASILVLVIGGSLLFIVLRIRHTLLNKRRELSFLDASLKVMALRKLYKLFK